MAGRKMNRKMEVSDVVSVLREVLEGGPPSQEDLFEPRYKPARQLALGNDDGAALVFERRRKLASSNSTTDSDYRCLMDLPAPRARRGTPRGLVFRGRHPCRPVSADTVKAVLRDAGASSTELKSVHIRWCEAKSNSRLVGQGMAWDERGGPLEQWGAQLEPGLAGLI